MKDLIKKIEELKCRKSVMSDSIIYNEAIDDVIRTLQSHPVIHAKALRKKGTDKWYYWDSNVTGCSESNDIKLISDKELKYYVPKDAELVDLTIIVEGGEG